MNWLILVIISIISLAVSSLFQKKSVLNKEVNPIAFAAAFQLFIALILGIVVFIKGFQTPDIKILGINFLIMTLLYMVGNIFKFKALKEIEASEYTILFQIAPIITVFLAISLLGELFVFKQFLGLALIIIAIIIITAKKGLKIKLKKGEIFALITAVSFGAGFVNDAYILQTYDVWSFTFLAFLIPGLFTLIYSGKNIHSIKSIFKKENIFWFIPAIVFYAIATLTIYMSYQSGHNVAQISSISQTVTILIVILAAIFLKERDKLPKKLVAAIISVIGVIMIK